MERATFLRHYRIRLNADGTPYELSRTGPAASYEAVDERTGEPVSLTLIPAAIVGPALWEQFEEQISSAQKLRHVNIAKILDFGREGDDFVYVSERLSGETLASWVSNHGPMPGDLALRVAEQIVSVLSSARFHKLAYPSIEPSDIIIVPGQTPEGTWPLVKLTNFGLPLVGSLNHAEVRDSVNSGESQERRDFEPSTDETSDIRIQIYSLGATLYFLLTGTALPAEPLARPPKFSRFPKPLRTLLARMLHPDADQRPKDLIVLGESIRECLLKMERRRAFADKYGIPLRTTIPLAVEKQPRRLLPKALAVTALLLAAALIAAVMLPEPIGRLVHRPGGTKTIGTLIGVPESLAPAPVAKTTSTTSAPATGADTAAPVANQAPANPARASNSPQPEPLSAEQTQTSNVQPQAAVRNVSGANSPGASGNASSEGATQSSSKADETAQSGTLSQSSTRGKKKGAVTASARRARATRVLPEGRQERRVDSVRSRLVGITPDGRLILRLPSGRVAILTPDADEEEFLPRVRRRVMQRDEMMFAPPSQFEPEHFPYD